MPLREGQFLWGLLLMTLGLFEKVVLADTMLSGSADRIFTYAGPLIALDSWMGVMAFAGQIFLILPAIPHALSGLRCALVFI